MSRLLLVLACIAVSMTACIHADHAASPPEPAASAPASDSAMPFTVTDVASLDEPWAMTFLPDGRLLVSEKKGALKLFEIGARAVDVRGVPEVAYGGQGGFGDIVLHPDFAGNGLVYLSYAEAG